MTSSTTWTIEELHHHILSEAADIANKRLSVEQSSIVSGNVFRPEPTKSKRGGLCLAIEEGFVATRTSEQIEELHDIGRQAVRQALVERKDHFVGLILGEARQGRNYFDRFAMVDEQRKML